LQKFGREVAGRIVLFPLAVCELGKQLGLFERPFAGGLALGPQGAELGHILLNGAVDALLIERQELEILALGEPGLSFGERFVDGNLGGVFSDSPAGVAKLTEYAAANRPVSMARARLRRKYIFGLESVSCFACHTN
jgi:hypothetical protein